MTSGCRLALVYNLASSPTSLPSWDETSANPLAVRRIVALAQQWAADPSAPRCLCYVFDHSYSEASLRQGLGALKGTDRSAAQVRSGKAAAKVHPCLLPQQCMPQPLA